MDTEEREIFQFLKNWGADFTSAAEICRRAGTKKKFYDDPNWAKAILMRMEERAILESDIHGRYRIKPVSRRKKGKQWVAPNIAEILKESGVEVDEAGEGAELADDEYYEQL
jgi:hypothetical protein